MLSLSTLVLGSTLATASFVSAPFQSGSLSRANVEAFQRSFEGRLTMNRVELTQPRAGPALGNCARSAAACTEQLAQEQNARAFLRGSIETTTTGLRYQIEAVSPGGKVVASDDGIAPTSSLLVAKLESSADRMAEALLDWATADERRGQRLGLDGQVATWCGAATLAGGAALFFAGRAEAGRLSTSDPAQRLSVDEAFTAASRANTERTIGVILMVAGAGATLTGALLWHASNRTYVTVGATPTGGAIAVGGTLP